MLANQPNLIDSIGVVVRPNGEAFNAFIGQPWSHQVADGADVLGPCFSAAMFRTDAFDAGVVGPLDERYRLYYEDIDWALRARRAGFRIVAVPEAVVFHQHAASTRLLGEPARYELVQRNLLVCAAKNFTLLAAVRVWGSRLVVHTKGVITGPYRQQRLRSIGRALMALPSALMARRGLPRHRAVAEATLFAYSAGLEPNFDTDTYRAS
jgi:GT2 family glycosyltransferase